jgi:hypothetical protein
MIRTGLSRILIACKWIKKSAKKHFMAILAKNFPGTFGNDGQPQKTLMQKPPVFFRHCHSMSGN